LTPSPDLERTSTCLAIDIASQPQPATGELDRRLVSGDEPIGDVVQVVADNVRLRTDSQDIVADTLDQRGKAKAV
jgi:hypothetical protein